MRRLDVRLRWAPGAERRVGTLGEGDRRIHFEFDAAFLDDPLPISPFHLKPEPGLHQHPARDFDGVSGVFHDSLPDGWGRLLMDRYFRGQGVDPVRLSALDRLGYIGTRGMGALTYHPPTASSEQDGIGLELGKLAAQATRILEGSPEEVLPELRIAGGSPGGARPKVVAAYHEASHRLISGASEIPAGHQALMVKFGVKEDGPDIGAVEYTYALMAQAAGITMPPVRLFDAEDGGRYFAVERFDRRGDERIHLHTLGGLLHASHRYPSLDYEAFLRATLELTRDQRQVEEAFRRAVFNVLAHNRDDHSKNFSYIMDRDGVWTLAPAYDLVFSQGISGWHSMSVAGEAEDPDEDDLRKLAKTFALRQSSVDEIMEQVHAAVAQWPELAGEAGVSGERRQEIYSRLAER